MVSMIFTAIVIVVCISILALIVGIFIMAAKEPEVKDGVNPIIRVGNTDENYWRS